MNSNNNSKHRLDQKREVIVTKAISNVTQGQNLQLNSVQKVAALSELVEQKKGRRRCSGPYWRVDYIRVQILIELYQPFEVIRAEIYHDVRKPEG